MRKLFLAALLLPLGGCPFTASTVNTDATSIEDAAAKEIAGIDALAKLYVTLPLCSATQSAPCSTAALSAAIKADSAKARAAVDQAAAGAGTAAAVQAALNALLADFAAIQKG